MVKRFVDTEIWQKEWFQDLTLKEKILLRYIFENCDCAGVWNINFKLASFIIGDTVSVEDIHNINDKKLQFTILDDKNIYVNDFIKFQYGALSENCKPHKPVIEKLKKYNLFERVSKGYSKGIHTLEEKEKEKEEEKEKEKNISSSLVLSSSLQDDQKLYGKYGNVVMTTKQYDKLLGICTSQKLLDELVDSLSERIETGKEQPFRSSHPNAHFVRVQNFRKYRLQNPDKFTPINDTNAEKNNPVADDWYEKMKEKGYG